MEGFVGLGFGSSGSDAGSISDKEDDSPSDNSGPEEDESVLSIPMARVCLFLCPGCTPLCLQVCTPHHY